MRLSRFAVNATISRAFVTDKAVFIAKEGDLLSFNGKTLTSITRDEWASAYEKARYVLYEDGYRIPEGVKAAREVALVPSLNINTLQLQTISFKKPIGCIQKPRSLLDGNMESNVVRSLGKADKEGFYIQPKLDGNRICVYIEVIAGRPLISYYSRTGEKKSKGFNRVFDDGILALYRNLAKADERVMVNCECYKHGWSLQKITGCCNRHNADDSDFGQLSLYVLSYVMLDTPVPLLFSRVFEVLDSLPKNVCWERHRQPWSSGQSGLVGEPVYGERPLERI